MLRIATAFPMRNFVPEFRRRFVPAPSVDWDPSIAKPNRKASDAASTIGITIRLPEDAVLDAQGVVGTTLFEALTDADLSDIWSGAGACGGACQCSTCRVQIEHAPVLLPERGEDEEDMLDTAASAAMRQNNDDALADAYLDEKSRLSCQLVLRTADDGLVVTLPEDVLNVLEVPLWLRGSR